MYAPSFPSPKFPRPSWHKVNPLDLVHPVCGVRIVLNCVKVRDEVPDGESYCANCRAHELRRTPNAETVAAFKDEGQVYHGPTEAVLADILGDGQQI